MTKEEARKIAAGIAKLPGAAETTAGLVRRAHNTGCQERASALWSIGAWWLHRSLVAADIIVQPGEGV